MTSLYSIGDITKQFVKSALGEDAGIFRGTLALIVFPLIITGSLLYLGFDIGPEVLKAIISTVAILVGFSLNAVLLLLRYSENTDSSDKLMRIVRHISIYSVLVGVIVVAVSLSSLLIINNVHNCVVVDIVSGIMFLSASHYLLTVLLLPARVFVVVELAEGS